MIRTLISLVGLATVAAGASRYWQQHRIILAYRNEVAELTNQIIELRRAQHRAGIASGHSDWPGRIIDEFSYARERHLRRQAQMKEHPTP